MIFSWIFSNNDLMKYINDALLLYYCRTCSVSSFWQQMYMLQFFKTNRRCWDAQMAFTAQSLLQNQWCPNGFFLNSHTYHLILILRQVEAFWGSKCIFESLVLNIWVFFPSCSRRHWKLNLHLGSIKDLPSKRHLDSVSVKKDWKLKDSSNWWLTGWWFTFSILFWVC